MVRSGGGEERLSDVVLGDVWVCSGQSNMGWALFQTKPLPQTYPHADKLRLIKGKVVTDERPRTDFVRDEKDFPEGWERAEKEHALEISAVSYYMGREICEQTGIPVGIVVVALGGSQIWPWMTPASIEGHPEETMAREDGRREWAWAQGQARRLREGGNAERADRLLYNYRGKAPSRLYHAMIHPLTQMPIAGMLWYQGERSQDNPPPYRIELLPQIILLDLSMPIMDGWGFLEEYKLLILAIGKKITLYIVTSSISPHDIERAKNINAVSDYIIKPVTKEKFAGIIKSYNGC